MFVPLGSLHREGPSQGLGRPSDRKLDDKKEHKLLHKYSRATHREACALTTHHIQSSLSFSIVRLFSWDSCQRGENFVASVYKRFVGIILLTSQSCVFLSLCSLAWTACAWLAGSESHHTRDSESVCSVARRGWSSEGFSGREKMLTRRLIITGGRGTN